MRNNEIETLISIEFIRAADARVFGCLIAAMHMVSLRWGWLLERNTSDKSPFYLNNRRIKGGKWMSLEHLGADIHTDLI